MEGAPWKYLNRVSSSMSAGRLPTNTFVLGALPLLLVEVLVMPLEALELLSTALLVPLAATGATALGTGTAACVPPTAFRTVAAANFAGGG